MYCSKISAIGGGLLQGIQVDNLLYMKWYNVFTLVAQIHSFGNISNAVDTNIGYIQLLSIIFVLESYRWYRSTLPCSPFALWCW